MATGAEERHAIAHVSANGVRNSARADAFLPRRINATT